ncbi:MAG: hypothetical protein KC464_34020, partial [Myxococcales bacterium]|nr:hypothetical protein [Myxococcales bacterium]
MSCLAIPLGGLTAGCADHAAGDDDVGVTSPDAGVDGDVGLACADDPGPGGALVFDGVDDVARTALRPELGLDRFTVEAWLRRDGAGTTFTSGAGGLR